ncbi:MAG: site-2 protease family protein [Halobacteriaceae archaeon]
MNTLLWVLVGVALFWVLAMLIKARGYLPESVRVYGPLVTVHTRRGRALLGRLARPKRLWRMWGNLGLGIALMVMVVSTVFLAVVAVLTLLNPPEPTAVNRPQNVLVIPGVNDFLPLSVAPEILAGLAIGLVVHEAGHGILCRVEDIEIESLGLVFLTLLPAGAFVEQDLDSQWLASRGGRGRMLAAGVTNNFAITGLAFLLLFGPVAGSVSVAAGAAVGGVLDGGPAATVGLSQGDRIVGVNGRTIEDNDALRTALETNGEETVSVSLASGETVAIDRRVKVIGGVTDGPTGLAVNDTIVAVNGTAITTEAALYDALRNRTIVSVRTADGSQHTFAAGAYVIVSEGGPLNVSGGAPAGPLTITRINGNRTVSMDALTRELSNLPAGRTVGLVGYRNGTRYTYEVTLGTDEDGSGFLGVFTGATGVTGLRFNDLGLQTYPAANYLCVLGGSCVGAPSIDLGFFERIWFALRLPLVGITSSPVFPFNFAGFAGGTANFYTGPPLIFLLANLLFWTGWVNLNLAIFNCIPTFALDGGHILRTAVESVAARLPVSDPRQVVTAATLSVQAVMLGSLLLLLFGAQLLN